MELATRASCRVGMCQVLIVPWYTSTLNKHPSNCLGWIAIEGRRVWEALQFLHNKGYAHMNVKAMNIPVEHANHWFLGDFGSCKPLGTLVTSCSIAFCWMNVIGHRAIAKYDNFMFLLMLLIECCTLCTLTTLLNALALCQS
ncbi:protein kinase family protein [archaeon]|nr:MAG: protein kinase family protein [archaeon]